MPLHRVHVGNKFLQEYASLQGPAIMGEIRQLAPALEGLRMLHLSATAYGGGVAEIMYTLVPLLRDAGIDCEWRIMQGEPAFFDATKAIHNGLQGDPRGLTPEQVDVFLRTNQENARQLLDDDVDTFDVIVVHDPQPAFVPRHLGDVGAHLVWRCHIDLSTPNPAVLDVLAPALAGYDAAIFHLPEFVPGGVALRQPITWPPAIDPLAPKNMALAREDAAFITRQFGLDVERPSMLQVSRFDPWKDPLGVIDAYRQVRRDVPALQLALVGAMAHDDPEGLAVYQECLAHADRDPEHHHPVQHGQRRRGRGQRVPVPRRRRGAEVAAGGLRPDRERGPVEGPADRRRRVGGIRLQIEQGVTGWLVDSPESCAEAASRCCGIPTTRT